MKLSLGISSCPNDTFVFDAMIHGKVDTEGLTFGLTIADVEELNRKTLQAELDISKVSYNVYPFIAGNYLLLNSGSALGRGNGPLVISKRHLTKDELPGLRIAIPGKLTTANLLFSIFFPGAANKREYLFSDIVDAVLSGEADAGVIIHESRFTYRQKGLLKIADLGEMWEESTGNPIPLGGIVARQNLGNETLLKIDRIVKRGVEYAFAHPDSSLEFVRNNAKELEEAVINQHISLYVNQYTVDLGQDGKQAVTELYEKAFRTGLIPELPVEIFVHKNAE